jgi:hypothetical protein
MRFLRVDGLSIYSGCAAAIALAVASIGCGSDDDGGFSRVDSGSSSGRDAGGGSGGDDDAGGSDTACEPASLVTLTSDDVSEGGVLARGCYLIEQSLVVSSGTLDIEPGSELYFEEGRSLKAQLDGALRAQGTAAEPILFTTVDANTPTYWQGLRYEGSDSANNVLEHVIVEYAGSDAFDCAEPANVSLDQRGGNGAGVAIRSSVLRNGAGTGLCSVDGSNISEFSNNTVTGNAGGAMLIDGSNMGGFPTDAPDANDFTGNGEDYVYVRGGTYNSEIGRSPSTTTTVAALNVPYRVRDYISVGEGTVEIQAGTVLEMEEGVDMLVRQTGALTVAGTAADPVRITSSNTELPAHWGRIQFRGSASAANLMEHVLIEYGGKGAPGEETGAIYLLQQAGTAPQLRLRDVTLKQSERYAVWLDDGALTECTNVAFESNGDGDLGGDTSSTNCD